MKVSIITPCYNSASYIRNTIASVQSQSLTDWEMIVVDDGSTDDSADIIKQLSAQDPRIKLVQKENGGSASARKLGLSLAQGEYIQFLDADDSLDYDKFRLQITQMEHYSLDVSYTDWCWIYINEEKSATRGLYCNLFRLLTIWGPLGTLPTHCFIYKHDFLKKNNINIPTHIKEREDWDFHIEVFSHNPEVQRIAGYCGALYRKAPTGKTTGASLAKISIGTFNFLTYRIGKEQGYRKFLLSLRFSIEMCQWWLHIQKTSQQKLLSHLDIKSNKICRKAFIKGIILAPISLGILIANSIVQRFKTFIKKLC